MLRALRKIDGFARERLLRAGPARVAVASFALVILLGALVLMLPVSSQERVWTHPVDALFTSTSAVCVTGLIVRSTPDHWSLFGQLTILVLIQVGGLGIMTLGAFVAIMLQRRLSMRFESVMADIVESDRGESVWQLILFICLFTFVMEVVGAVALYFSWRGEFSGFWPAFYHSVFHSISAFCNAGFSLNNDSLVRYVDSVPVNLIVTGLIIFGGIGFLVVREVAGFGRWWMAERRGRRPRLTTHTRLVLLVTGVLLVVGFFGFLVIESGGSMAEAPWTERLLASWFQSVTPRTAGFNTVDTGAAALSQATAFMLMVLMYIGGSPGGTAGGIKTSTLGIMVSSIAATLRGRERVEMFHHSIPVETVHRVTSIVLLSVMAVVVGTFLLLATEAASFQKILFDAISAFGTVGLSQGLTGPGSDVTVSGRLVLTALMFVGRLGPVTLMLSVAGEAETASYQYPEERVMVG